MRKLYAVPEIPTFFVQTRGCTCTLSPYLWKDNQVKKNKEMTGNIPGGNFMAGNFSVKRLMGENFLGGNIPRAKKTIRDPKY